MGDCVFHWLGEDAIGAYGMPDQAFQIVERRFRTYRQLGECYPLGWSKSLRNFEVLNKVQRKLTIELCGLENGL